MNARLVTLFLAGPCLAGCFPYQYTIRPGVSGSVVDDLEATPIPNASIVVHTHYDAKHTGETRITPNPDGTFFLAPAKKWGIYVMPMDVFFPWSDATVEATGYQKKDFRLIDDPMGRSKVVLGEVRLIRIQ
jgi:hypothetical protein